MTRRPLLNPFLPATEVSWPSLLLCAILVLTVHVHLARADDIAPDGFFTLESGFDLRDVRDREVRSLLTPVRGQGKAFGMSQRNRYCEITENPEQVQWVLNNLETGEIISRSPNARERYFGASSSKLFVAAALLDKQNGKATEAQLELLVRMIVVSSNIAWKELQRQVGNDGTDDSGREAVDRFVRKMGYTNTKGFQGWLTRKDGTRIHGNELNTMDLAKFLYDTRHRRYKGAEVLWKIMHATKTGKTRVDKYTPTSVYVGGKTGTYHGPNQSPETIRHETIRARNHVAILRINDEYYGLSILTNTGSNEDVAILGGGLLRDYLNGSKAHLCPTRLGKLGVSAQP